MDLDAHLIEAVKARNEAQVRSLLAQGACPDARTRGQWPVIALARSQAIVELLARAGADVDARMSDGMTALMFRCREWSAEAVEALLRAGADGSATDALGRTASDFAMMDHLQAPPINLGKFATLKALAAHGVMDARTCEALGHTLLVRAAAGGRIHDVRSLLQMGVSRDAGYGPGDTPMAVAHRNGWMHVVRVLEHGLDARPVFTSPEAPRIPAQTRQHIDAALHRIRSLLVRPGAPELEPPLAEEEVERLERSRGIVLPGGYRRFVTEVGHGGPFTDVAEAIADAEWPERPFPLGRAILYEPDPAQPDLHYEIPETIDPWDGTIELDFRADELTLLVVTGDRVGQVWLSPDGGVEPAMRNGEPLDALSWIEWKLDS